MKTDTCRDVMQVCLNGHVMTDLLGTQPEQGRSYCDRCGAPTLSRCPTCGAALPGATPLPGLAPMGVRAAPRHCADCGAALPWTARAHAAPPATFAALEPLLRRVPRLARQLRERHGTRPAFRLEDVHDLADLLRAALHLSFDDVRRQARTPSYAADTRTDFLVGPERIAVTAKLAGDPMQLADEIRIDVADYETQGDCGGLVVLIYDAAQRLHEPDRLEAEWGRAETTLSVRCVVAR